MPPAGAPPRAKVIGGRMAAANGKLDELTAAVATLQATVDRIAAKVKA